MASTQVDRIGGLTGSIAVKTPVKCATTANITLAGEQTIDGVTTSSSRVLVKNQTDERENGIYDSSSGLWSRTKDMNGVRDARKGTQVLVTDGLENGETIWVLQADTDIVEFGVTEITFEAFEVIVTAAYLRAVITSIQPGDILVWDGINFINRGLEGRENNWTANQSFSGDVSLASKTIIPFKSELTISSGVITPNGCVHTVDTESGAATDNLDTIAGGEEGQFLFLSAASGSRVTTLTTSGNIAINGASTIALSNTSIVVMLLYNAALSKWIVINRFSTASATTYVQHVIATVATASTGSTQFVNDDTIPQNTEGFEVVTATITPTSATNKLIIEGEIHIGSAVAEWIGLGVFQDSTADALYFVTNRAATSNQMVTIPFRHEMVSGTTSATTFKVRVGPITAATTLTINGTGGARKFGGVAISSLTVTEVSA